MAMQKIIYRKVVKNDFDDVTKFVDKWLSGRAIKEGGGNDYFVTKNQHKSYFKNCHVWIALDDKKIVAWVVKEKTNILIHLLVAADYRKMGIGQELMRIINPDIIRSKSDQMTGNPNKFYQKMGYKSINKSMVGTKKNIELMTK